MKEIKDKKIDVRVTAAEKERIKEYAEAHDMTVGDLIRKAIIRYIAIAEKEEE